MARKHNSYFGPFCPKNTISCGGSSDRSQYIGPSEKAFLSSLTYDPRPQKATYDLMSRAWKAATPMRKVVRLRATRANTDCQICGQGIG